MNEELELRPCLADDADAVVPLIHDSGPVAFRWVLSQRHRGQSMEFLDAVFRRGSGQFGFRNHLLAEREGKAVGVVAVWDARLNATFTLDALRSIGGFFGLGALLAGFAGLMAGPLLSVQVGMGEQILILTFVVVVIGGLGSVAGAFWGALLVGVVDTGLRAFLPQLMRLMMNNSEADALAAGVSAMGIYLVMAIVLLVRPKGLFPGHA